MVDSFKAYRKKKHVPLRFETITKLAHPFQEDQAGSRPLPAQLFLWIFLSSHASWNKPWIYNTMAKQRTNKHISFGRDRWEE